MKIFRCIITLVIALAIIVTAKPNKAYAGTDTVDFENGNFDAFVLRIDPDTDISVLSVVDFNGSKALKVDVQDASKTPKIQINVSDLVDPLKLDAIQSIEFDLVIENPDGNPIGINNGGIGNEGEHHSPLWSQGEDWSIQDDNHSVSQVTKISRSFKNGSEKFINGKKSVYVFMKWSGNANDMYIDNLRFLDADGNPITLSTTPAISEDIPKTGSKSFMGYLIAAILMLTGVIVIRRRTVPTDFQ